MILSVIIVNHKTPELTSDCLASLSALPHPEDREIIVIDNASGDDSFELLQAQAPGRFKLLANQENLGFGGANNRGAKEASGRYLLFLNSDTIVRDDIFQEAARIFAENEKIGIISPRLEDEHGKNQADACGSFPTLASTVIKKLKKINEQSENNEMRSVDWVSGCALFIRQDLFSRLGGFDEDFFLYFEDVDLCRRVKNLGYEIIVTKKFCLTHLGGRSLKQSAARKRYYYRSQDIYFKKYRSKLEGLFPKLLRFPLALIRGMGF